MQFHVYMCTIVIVRRGLQINKIGKIFGPSSRRLRLQKYWQLSFVKNRLSRWTWIRKIVFHFQNNFRYLLILPGRLRQLRFYWWPLAITFQSLTFNFSIFFSLFKNKIKYLFMTLSHYLSQRSILIGHCLGAYANDWKRLKFEMWIIQLEQISNNSEFFDKFFCL